MVVLGWGVALAQGLARLTPGPALLRAVDLMEDLHMQFFFKRLIILFPPRALYFSGIRCFPLKQESDFKSLSRYCNYRIITKNRFPS